MRLVDQIIQDHCWDVARSEPGQMMRLHPNSDTRTALERCAVRYVLDPASSRQCSDLLNDAPAMFNPADSYLRVASESIWLELFSDPANDVRNTRRLRIGALVSTDSSGRRGTIQGFYEGPDRPRMDGGCIEFDLDRALQPGPLAFRMRQASLPHLNMLFEHTLLTLRPECSSVLRGKPEVAQRAFVSDLAENCWFHLPAVLAFSAMLNSGGILEQQPSNLDKINRARCKAKKRPLLDHVEVRMDLGFTRACLGGEGLGVTRSSPRLHYVRGHLVRRGAMTFWRSSHLRGDVAQPVLPRTINFRAQGR